jgi:ATP-dependent RNA helicase DDX6/DHH1
MPGMGMGRGGGMNANPAFQSRAPQQQYVQRSMVQQHNHHHQQQQYHQQQQQQQHQQQQQQQQQQQHQQQQQWLRRGQLGGVDSGIDEVEKTVQSEAVDSRCVSFRNISCMFVYV